MPSRGSSTELEIREEPSFPQTEPFPNTYGNGLLDENQGIDQQLQPADRGAAAWKVLFAAFMFEALFWGKLRNPHMPYPHVDDSLN